MISKSEILMGREHGYPLTAGMIVNLNNLLKAVNIVRAAYGKPLLVSSGYRPAEFNTKAGGAKNSAHLTCEAVDFIDPDQAFSKWCLANLPILEQAGLWMESPAHTVGWVHLQIRPVSVRVFIP